MDQARNFTRTCPTHHTEIVFRPMRILGARGAGCGITEVPWCLGPHSHVCDYWLVQAADGDVWAAATLAGYMPCFDVDAVLAEALSLDARRRVAEPQSNEAEAVA